MDTDILILKDLSEVLDPRLKDEVFLKPVLNPMEQVEKHKKNLKTPRKP